MWVLANGDVLVVGETRSDLEEADLTPNDPNDDAYPFDDTLPGFDQIRNSSPGGQVLDGWVAVLTPDMSAVKYWTYLGGDAEDRAYFGMEDASGDIWVCGFTESNCSGTGSFPGASCALKNGSQSYPAAAFDVFLVRLSFDLQNLELSLVIGGDGKENSRGNLWVTQETDGFYAYLAGMTASGFGSGTTGFPTTRDHADDNSEDGFLMKIKDDGTLAWSRSIGGTANDNAWANPRKHPTEDWVYIGGCTKSTDLFTRHPLPPGYMPFQPSLNPPADGFVARFDSNNGDLQAGTYLGGTGTDWVAFNDCLELDQLNRVAVQGITRSLDFPWTPDHIWNKHSLDDGTPSPPQPPDDPDSNDLFLSILEPDLTALAFSTYVNGGPGGATEREEPAGLAVDEVGYVYMTGETLSQGFPITANAYDATSIAPTHNDAYLVRIYDRPGNQTTQASLLYGTFFGGSNHAGGAGSLGGNRGRSLSVVHSGGHAAFVGHPIFCGQTTTDDFPTTPGAVIPTWFAGDERSGWINVHDTK